MSDPDPRDKPLERICFTKSGKAAHFTIGEYHMSTTTYCGTSWYRLPTTEDDWDHVKRLPTCRRCEEILRPMPKNFTHTIKVEITPDSTLILYNGGKLPVMAQHAIMSQALWEMDQDAIHNIEGFPYDKGEGWAKYRFSKIKELRNQ